MSAILPPEHVIWWKQPLDKVEAIWISIAFIWCLVMFFMMPYWHIYGKQNLSSETYKTTPEAYGKKVQDLAIRAFQAVDCTGLARVDFLMDPKTRKLFVNEINTMPGFTAISMYPKLWAASGLSYPDLIDRLIQLGMERHADKKKNQYSR